MNIRQAISASVCILSPLALVGQANDWENPHVFGINKLPYHVTLGLPSAISDRQDVISLDGEWSFKWSPDPESRPIGFEAEGFDVSGWDKIAVPGNYGYELNRGDFVNVNIDHNLHGVGGTDTWGRPTLDRYRVRGTDLHRYSFMLSTVQ